MYIIELITKIFKGKKYKSHYKYNPDYNEDITENSQECNHLFMPLDSSSEYLACKYCGYVISKKANDHKNQNGLT